MLNMPVLKFEKSTNYLNHQLEIQLNNKQLVTDIISNINLILANMSDKNNSNYLSIQDSANNFLQLISQNITIIEELNREIKHITYDLTEVLSEASKRLKQKEYYIAAISSVKTNIENYTSKFQKIEKKLEQDNRDFNDFINVNNFKYNFVSTHNNDTYEFSGFSIDTQNSDNEPIKQEINSKSEKEEKIDELANKFKSMLSNLSEAEILNFDLKQSLKTSSTTNSINESKEEISVEDSQVSLDDVVEEENLIEDSQDILNDEVEKEDLVEDSLVSLDDVEEDNLIENSLDILDEPEKEDLVEDSLVSFDVETEEENLLEDSQDILDDVVEEENLIENSLNSLDKTEEENLIEGILKILDKTDKEILVEEILNVLDKNDKKNLVEGILNILNKTNKENLIENSLDILDEPEEENLIEDSLDILDDETEEEIQESNIVIDYASIYGNYHSTTFSTIEDDIYNEYSSFSTSFSNSTSNPIYLENNFDNNENIKVSEDSENVSNLDVSKNIELTDNDILEQILEEEIENQTLEKVQSSPIPNEENLSNIIDDISDDNLLAELLISDLSTEEISIEPGTIIEESSNDLDSITEDLSNESETTIDESSNDLDSITEDVSNEYETTIDEPSNDLESITEVVSNELETTIDEPSNDLDSITEDISNEPETTIDEPSNKLESIPEKISIEEKTTINESSKNLKSITEEIPNKSKITIKGPSNNFKAIIKEASDNSNPTIKENYNNSKKEDFKNVQEKSRKSAKIDYNNFQNHNLEEKIRIIKEGYINNDTLIISERQNKIFLPYSVDELKSYLKSYPEFYSSLSEVVEQEFIIPLDTFFKHPAKTRFYETYNLIRNRQGRSILYSLISAFELLGKYNLNPAIIAACKTEEQLDSYLYYLNSNKLNKFKLFNIIYEINPLEK